MEKIFNDRYLKSLIGLSAYFFLLVLLLHALGRPLNVSSYLFLAAVLLLVIRFVYLLFTRKKRSEPARTSPRAAIVRNAMIPMGYWVLVAILVKDSFGAVWPVYALIALTLVLALAAWVFVGKKAN